MNFYSVRNMLGLLKHKVCNCWPFFLQKRYAMKLRKSLYGSAFSLPSLATPREPTAEIHMLCGKEQLNMGIWSSWSGLRFLKNVILYVHSDGTLNHDDFILWKKVIPGSFLIKKEDSNNKATEIMSKRYPLLYRWRGLNWAAAQIIDYHLFGNQNIVISMDADVLFFKEPIELCLAIEKKYHPYIGTRISAHVILAVLKF